MSWREKLSGKKPQSPPVQREVQSNGKLRKNGRLVGARSPAQQTASGGRSPAGLSPQSGSAQAVGVGLIPNLTPARSDITSASNGRNGAGGGSTAHSIKVTNTDESGDPHPRSIR